MLSTKERLYLFLELEKFKEDHHKMPTVFIFPKGRLIFNGIIYSQHSPGNCLEFILQKQEIDDVWLVKMDGNTIHDFGYKEISNTMLKLNLYYGCFNSIYPKSDRFNKF